MIGAIADDVTGASDVAVAFRRAGLRTAIFFGVPEGELDTELDAVVVALKSRTIDPDDAVRISLDAYAWLARVGADRFYFKYCSTFDSRPEGNIGPVADALRERLGTSAVAVVPASPEHRRTQYLGYLFAGDQLLSESPMRTHPLTPMTDSYIPRVLGAQTSADVALIDRSIVREGVESVRRHLDDARAAGVGYVVIDAIDDHDLDIVGEAVAADALVTGAAGLAGGIARSIAAGPSRRSVGAPVGGPAVALAGSCSARTLEQIARMSLRHPSFRLDALALPEPEQLAQGALVWYDAQKAGEPVLIYSSLAPADLKIVQDELGVERSAEILERAMGRIAQGLVARGVRRIVVAGGETSGSVVAALDITGGEIGPEEAPGVPWITTLGEQPLSVLLKSGNFGDVDLLVRATEVTA